MTTPYREKLIEVKGRVAEAKTVAMTKHEIFVSLNVSVTPPAQGDFDEIVRLIEAARTRAFAAVNTMLVELYRRIGEYIRRKIESASWGESVVDQVAAHIARTHPGPRGYTRPNLFRMRQFYETYRGDEKVSALLRQLPWIYKLLILGKSKRALEREFYPDMALRERWSKRELEQHRNGALFERVVLSLTKVKDNKAVENALCRSMSPVLAVDRARQDLAFHVN
jgi:predicted nuclease of restriction endonuclease-like (RecB) superfamily